MTHTGRIMEEAARDRSRGLRAFVHVVACGKAKLLVPARAADIYTGDLTRKQIQGAQDGPGRFLILSAEHGLLDPDQIITPYDRTMASMPAPERAEWADRVIGQLVGLGSLRWDVGAWAGRSYLDPLRAAAERQGASEGAEIHVHDLYSHAPSSLSRSLGRSPEIGDRKRMWCLSVARRACAFPGADRTATTTRRSPC